MSDIKEQAQSLESRTKIIGNIVTHLKGYPFLLVSMAGLIVLTIVLAFDVEKLKEFKLLLYAVILIPLVMQFYFEAQKQREKHRSERVQQQQEHQQSANAAGISTASVAVQQTSEAKYSRKALVGIVLLVMAYAEIGDTPDDELMDLAFGAFSLGLITLWLGIAAHNDVKKQRATGKGLAITVIALAALMVLGSLGWISETAVLIDM